VADHRTAAAFFLVGDVKQLIGVELTESYLMSPIKSISGLIFPTDVSFVNCPVMPRENCPGRKAPYDEILLHTKFSPRSELPLTEKTGFFNVPLSLGK
jgi:hypothetical protein